VQEYHSVQRLLDICVNLFALFVFAQVFVFVITVIHCFKTPGSHRE